MVGTAQGRLCPRTNNVIASVAKQSISQRRGRMDCFVASAPRNDVVRSQLNFQKSRHAFAFSRHGLPELYWNVCPSKKRERGMPGARCTRGLVCKSSAKKR